MSAVWASESTAAEDTAASVLVKKGARRDAWPDVLGDATVGGVSVSDVDITIERHVATLTVLETVPNGAVRARPRCTVTLYRHTDIASWPRAQTLLATQTFVGVGDGDGERRWSMVSHVTIPYGRDVVAKVALRCDALGCVAVNAKAVASSA